MALLAFLARLITVYPLYKPLPASIMQGMADGVYLDLDGAFEARVLGLATVDARLWGPVLRYLARRDDMKRFSTEIVATLPPFILYGSGDFHHLSGALVRHWATNARQPITLVSFDNHPDWDIRPPTWGCGGWVSRAVQYSKIARASVWGCGNFELAFPARLFRDCKAMASGKLEINAWAERQSATTAKRFNCMTRDNWRERFDRFADRISGQPAYVTVDLDCLRDEEIVTSWENGLFTADDVAWAIARLSESVHIIAGDICGSRSEPSYSRRFQRFAGKWDHPKLPPVPLEVARERNLPPIQTIWNALTGCRA